MATRREDTTWERYFLSLNLTCLDLIHEDSTTDRSKRIVENKTREERRVCILYNL